MTLREFYNNIKSLDVEEIKEQAVMENKEVIIQLNKIQLRSGYTSEGKGIEPKYSDLYLKRKRKMSSYGAPDGTPDLFLNGDFQEQMDVVVENGQYDIISWDVKNGFLTDRYADIFGLTDKHINEAQIPVTNTFIELIKNRLSN